jgi:hypothetical protein
MSDVTGGPAQLDVGAAERTVAWRARVCVRWGGCALAHAGALLLELQEHHDGSRDLSKFLLANDASLIDKPLGRYGPQLKRVRC